MKRLIVVGIMLLFSWLIYQFPHTMISPGELIEGHQKLNNECLACHEPFRGISNDKCISCHKLSDIGKDSLANASNMTNEKILFHERISTQKCTSCHFDHKGRKPSVSISRFSHEILSATELSNCNSCHAKPVDNLHKQLSSECNSCHNTDGWKSNMVFNHDMILGPGKNDCASCHNKPKDSFHQQLKDNCDKCHTTDKWKPPTFDHSNYFILDKHHNVECKTCHLNNNFNAYTCYGCHEHSENKIREEHIEHGISNFANCSRCHKSGNKHDIRMNGNSDQKLNQNDVNNINDQIRQKEKESHKEHGTREDDKD